MGKSRGEVGLDYWWRWQVPVCALIVALPAIICWILIKKKKMKATGDPPTYACLWIPCWKNLNPKWLFFYRAFALLSMASLLFLMLSLDGLFAFYFYTQWTFALVTIYFAVGTIISAQGCWLYVKLDSPIEDENDKFLDSDPEGLSPTTSGRFRPKGNTSSILQKHKESRFLGYLMLTIYQICAGAVILTDIVFWCVLVPTQSAKVTPLHGLIHSLNAILLVTDSSLNNLPFEWFGFAYFALWSTVYIIFQWVLHACGFTWWPYPFLELATPWAPVWYLGLTLFHLPCYGMYILLMKAKLSAFSRLSPKVSSVSVS